MLEDAIRRTVKGIHVLERPALPVDQVGAEATPEVTLGRVPLQEPLFGPPFSDDRSGPMEPDFGLCCDLGPDGIPKAVGDSLEGLLKAPAESVHLGLDNAEPVLGLLVPFRIRGHPPPPDRPRAAAARSWPAPQCPRWRWRPASSAGLAGFVRTRGGGGHAMRTEGWASRLVGRTEEAAAWAWVSALGPRSRPVSSC